MIAYDFYRIVPAGVGLVGITLMIDGWSEAEYEKALLRVDEAARELAARKVDYILHAGVPLVVSQGKNFDLKLIERMEKLTGIPATTSIRAAIDAFHEVGIRRLAIVDPYPDALNERLVSFLEGYGFRVLSVVSLKAGFRDLKEVSISRVYEVSRQTLEAVRDAEGLYLPCPQFPVVDIVERLEEEFRKPVIAHLCSEIWKPFKTLGIKASIRGYGQLLSSLTNGPQT
jgi:maleate isomerase